MPLGKSVYKFVAISEEGVASEITMRTYKLTLHTEITVDMAISNVIQALIHADVLLDDQGNMRGMSGRNVYRNSFYETPHLQISTSTIFPVSSYVTLQAAPLWILTP